MQLNLLPTDGGRGLVFFFSSKGQKPLSSLHGQGFMQIATLSPHTHNDTQQSGFRLFSFRDGAGNSLKSNQIFSSSSLKNSTNSAHLGGVTHPKRRLPPQSLPGGWGGTRGGTPQTSRPMKIRSAHDTWRPPPTPPPLPPSHHPQDAHRQDGR